MSDLIEQTTKLLVMLPRSKQQIVYRFVKNLVLAWDPGYVKVTKEEMAEIEVAEKSGFVDDSDIDWNNIGKD